MNFFKSERKLALKSKGQISLDYIISLVVFMTITLYIAFQVMRFAPLYLKEIREETLRSEAYQVSELLINDPGLPKYWDSLQVSQRDTIKRLGLSDNSSRMNLVSIDKANEFEQICNIENDYAMVEDRMGLDETGYNMHVTLVDLVEDTIIIDNCQSTITSEGRQTAVVRRIVALTNGNYAELVLRMW